MAKRNNFMYFPWMEKLFLWIFPFCVSLFIVVIGFKIQSYKGGVIAVAIASIVFYMIRRHRKGGKHNVYELIIGNDHYLIATASFSISDRSGSCALPTSIKTTEKWYQVSLRKRRRVKQAGIFLGFCAAAALFIYPLANGEKFVSTIRLSAKERNLITKIKLKDSR